MFPGREKKGSPQGSGSTGNDPNAEWTQPLPRHFFAAPCFAYRLVAPYGWDGTRRYHISPECRTGSLFLINPYGLRVRRDTRLQTRVKVRSRPRWQPAHHQGADSSINPAGFTIPFGDP